MTAKQAIAREVTEDVLMILLGIAIIFLPSGLPRIICLVALIIVAIYSCLEGVARITANADRHKAMVEENRRLAESLSIAKLTAKPTTEVVYQTPDIPELSVDDFTGNTERIKNFLSELYHGESLPNVYKSYFKRINDLNGADSQLASFKQLLTGPFVDGLSQIGMPLSEEDRKRILEDLLSFALLMLDFIETYRYNINNSPEQLISIKEATGEITKEEALASARMATDLADETPRYIRAIKSVLEGLKLDKNDFLYSGYKL
jgi:hypothetical protein